MAQLTHSKKKTQNKTKHIDLLSPQLLSQHNTQHKHAVEKTSDSSLSLHSMRNYWRALKSARPRVTSLISYRSETLQKALQSPSSKQNPQLLHIPDFDFHEAVSAFQSAPFPVSERGFPPPPPPLPPSTSSPSASFVRSRHES